MTDLRHNDDPSAIVDALAAIQHALHAIEHRLTLLERTVAARGRMCQHDQAPRDPEPYQDWTPS